jgi:hypothetical protein
MDSKIEPVADKTEPEIVKTSEITLEWSKRVQGRKVGDIVHLNNRQWVVITKAGPARAKTLTENDEDAGLGYEGQDYTSQDVEYRVATPEEIAAETTRRTARDDAAKAAKQAADPGHQFDLWRDAHRALIVDRADLPAGLKWERHTYKPPVSLAGGMEIFETATGPDGSLYGSYSTSNYDDHRESFAVAPATEEQRAALLAKLTSKKEAAQRAEADRLDAKATKNLAAREQISTLLGGAGPNDPLTHAEAVRLAAGLKALEVSPATRNHLPDFDGPDPVPEGFRARLAAAQRIAAGEAERNAYQPGPLFHVAAHHLAEGLSDIGKTKIRSRGSVASLGDLHANEHGDLFYTGAYSEPHNRDLGTEDLAKFKATASRAVRVSELPALTRDQATALLTRGVPEALENRIRPIVEGKGTDATPVPLTHGSTISTLYAPTAAAQQYARSVAHHIDSATVSSDPTAGTATLTLHVVPTGKVKPVAVGTLTFHEDGRVERQALGKHAKTFDQVPTPEAAAAAVQPAREALERVHRTQVLTPTDAALIRKHAAALSSAPTDQVPTLGAVVSTFGPHAGRTTTRDFRVERALEQARTGYHRTEQEARAAMDQFAAVVNETDATNEPYRKEMEAAKGDLQRKINLLTPQPKPEPAARAVAAAKVATGSYAKIRSGRYEGQWGGRVKGPVAVGDTVALTNSKQETKMHRVLHVIQTFPDGNSIVAIS